MNATMHDRFPLPGEPEYIEPAQYHLDPNDPEQADLAAFYVHDTQEPIQELPEPVVPLQRPETQNMQPINEGRFGLGALRTAVRRMRQR